MSTTEDRNVAYVQYRDVQVPICPDSDTVENTIRNGYIMQYLAKNCAFADELPFPTYIPVCGTQ